MTMGYFSGGIEGEMYVERYCERCIHRDGPDGQSSCAVWDAHLLANYAECENPDSILHMLIPMSADGLSNEQCLMFHEKEPTNA